MKLDYTHIIVVLDSSGSMGPRRDDVMGGFNTLLKDQAGGPGEVTMSLYTFADDVRRKGISLEKLQHFPPLDNHSYQPGGMTALYDAIGTAIQREGQVLALLPEDRRPGLVTLVIMTDGQENKSREYTLAKVRELLKEQQEKYSWVVQYLGVGLEAFEGAAQFDLDRGTVAQVGNSGLEAQASYSASSGSITRGRAARAGGQSLREVKTAGGFTEEERAKMLAEPKKDPNEAISDLFGSGFKPL